MSAYFREAPQVLYFETVKSPDDTWMEQWLEGTHHEIAIFNPSPISENGGVMRFLNWCFV